MGGTLFADQAPKETGKAVDRVQRAAAGIDNRRRQREEGPEDVGTGIDQVDRDGGRHRRHSRSSRRRAARAA